MTALRRIGGPNAISAWTFALTLVVFAIATLLPTSRDQVTGPAEARLAVAMLATAAAFVVLVLARLTVLGNRPRPSRPLVAILVFALAGVVQALALTALRPRFDLVPIEPSLLVLTRAAAGVVWLSIVAILVDEVRSHNERVAELVSRIEALRRVRAEEDAARAAAVAALRDETLEPLRRALDAIGAGLADAGGAERAQAEADRVRRLVEEEVRPASHALLDREADAADAWERPVILSARRRLRIILRLATGSLAAPTWLAVLLPLVIAMLFALQGIGLVFALVVSLSWIVVMSACFAVGRHLLDRRLGGLSGGAAAAVILATYAAFALVALVNNWFWGFLSPLGRWLEWPSLFVLPALWLGIALSRAAQAKREATEARLAAVLADLAAAEARRRQQLRHAYQDVGRLLHGDVQGSLLAVARRLEEAAALPAPERAAAVDEATDQLRRLQHRIVDGTGADWTAARALADIVDLWAGAAEVRLACDPAVLAAVDAAPATRTTLIDVVAEAVTNAVRHGGAQAIAVRLDRAAGGRLVLEVQDDGRPGPRGAAGMGTQLLDAVSPAWALDVGPDGARLRVEVVLDTVAEEVGAGA
jgi:signal transduction histidine kinase